MLPQLIPDRELVTVPLPVPVLLTLNEYCVAVVGLNAAVTLCGAAVMLIAQFPVPLQAPPQPANVEPLAELAVKVIDVPLL